MMVEMSSRDRNGICLTFHGQAFEEKKDRVVSFTIS